MNGFRLFVGTGLCCVQLPNFMIFLRISKLFEPYVVICCNFQTQVASGTWTTNFLRLSSFNSNLPKWQRYSKQHDARCFKKHLCFFICSFCCRIVVIVIIVKVVFVVAVVIVVTDIVVLVVVLFLLIIVVVVIVMILFFVLGLGVVIAALHLFQAT